MVYGFMYLVCFIDNHELKLAPDHKKIFHSYFYRHTYYVASYHVTKIFELKFPDLTCKLLLLG